MSEPTNRVDSGVHRYALVVNGDTEDRHLENARLAAESLRSQGYEVDEVSPDNGAGSPAEALAKMHKLKTLAADKNAEVVVYFTGHGDLKGEEPAVVMQGGDLRASQFVDELASLSCETTVVMDQCFSGNFAARFAEKSNIRFLGLSGKGLTDRCRPFAERLWNPSPDADDNHDGIISWQERFDFATQDSGVVDYSLSTYFSGRNVDDKISDKNILTVHTPAELEKEIVGLQGGEHAVVLFSAPWCDACQGYKPKFMSQSDGHYRYIIVDAEDISPFERFGLGASIPEVRLYGSDLLVVGLSLGTVPDDISTVVPKYLAFKGPEKMALHWLKNGTTEEQETAVEILYKLAGKVEPLDRIIYPDKGIKVSVVAKQSAIWLLPEAKDEKKISKEELYKRLNKIAGDKSMPVPVRAVAAAALLQDSYDEETGKKYNGLLKKALIKFPFELGKLGRYFAAEYVELDFPDIKMWARRFLKNPATKNPIEIDLLKGIVSNGGAASLFYKELEEIVANEAADPDLRRLALDRLNPNSSNLMTLTRQFVLSPNVPLGIKVKGCLGEYFCMDFRISLTGNKAGLYRIGMDFLDLQNSLSRNIVNVLKKLWGQHYSELLGRAADAIKPLAVKTFEGGTVDDKVAAIDAMRSHPRRNELFDVFFSNTQSARIREAVIKFREWSVSDKERLTNILFNQSENVKVRIEALHKLREALGENEWLAGMLIQLAGDPLAPKPLKEQAVFRMWQNPVFDDFYLGHYTDYGDEPAFNAGAVTHMIGCISDVSELEKIAYEKHPGTKFAYEALRELAGRFSELGDKSKQRLIRFLNGAKEGDGWEQYSVITRELPKGILKPRSKP